MKIISSISVCPRPVLQWCDQEHGLFLGANENGTHIFVIFAFPKRDMKVDSHATTMEGWQNLGVSADKPPFSVWYNLHAEWSREAFADKREYSFFYLCLECPPGTGRGCGKLMLLGVHEYPEKIQTLNG